MMDTSQVVGQFIYQIYISGVLYQGTPPLDVCLSQEFGKHEIFSMRIEYPRSLNHPNRISFFPENSPVKIIWGRKPDNISVWYGYVNHLEPKTPSDSGNNTFQVTYYLIGTSKPMNTDVHKNWGAVSPTYIARKIAAKYGFRSVLTSSGWVLPNEVQAGESDFRFLCRLAHKTGFRFWVSGGTLYFIDPAVVILSSRNSSAIPVFRQDKTFWQRDTMRKFSILRGDNLPGAVQAHRSVFGITDNNQLINPVADGGGGITQLKTSRHVNSFAEGRNITAAWQSMNQFWIGGNAELYGSKLVYPGKLIRLTGNWLPGDSDGYWIVTAAKHKLKSAYTTRTTDDWYITEVEMVRNTSGTSPNLKNIPVISPEFVNCTLFDQTWRADVLTAIYDGVAK